MIATKRLFLVSRIKLICPTNFGHKLVVKITNTQGGRGCISVTANLSPRTVPGYRVLVWRVITQKH